MPKKKSNSEGGDDIKGGGCPFIPAKFFNLCDEQIGLNGKRYRVAKRGEGEDESYFWHKIGERELKMRLLFIRDGKMTMPALARPTRNLHLLTGKLADYAKELPLDSGERFQPPTQDKFNTEQKFSFGTQPSFSSPPSTEQKFSFSTQPAFSTQPSFGLQPSFNTQPLQPSEPVKFTFSTAPAAAPVIANPFGGSSLNLSTDFKPGLFGQSAPSSSTPGLFFGQSSSSQSSSGQSSSGQSFGQNSFGHGSFGHGSSGHGSSGQTLTPSLSFGQTPAAQPTFGHGSSGQTLSFDHAPSFGHAPCFGQGSFGQGPQATPIMAPGGFYPGLREYPDTCMG